MNTIFHFHYLPSSDRHKADLFCPHCDWPLEVSWETEYADPQPGQYEEECTACGHRFTLKCEVVTTYKVL